MNTKTVVGINYLFGTFLIIFFVVGAIIIHSCVGEKQEEPIPTQKPEARWDVKSDIYEQRNVSIYSYDPITFYDIVGNYFWVRDDRKYTIENVTIVNIYEKYDCIKNCPYNNTPEHCEIGVCMREIYCHIDISEEFKEIYSECVNTVVVEVRYHYIREEMVT